MWFDRWQLRPDIMSLENPWPGPWGQVEVDAFLPPKPQAWLRVVIHRFDMFGWLPTMLPAGGGWSPGGHLVKLGFPPQKKVDWLCSVVAFFCSSFLFIFITVHSFSITFPVDVVSFNTFLHIKVTAQDPFQYSDAFEANFAEAGLCRGFQSRERRFYNLLPDASLCLFPFLTRYDAIFRSSPQHFSSDKYGTWHRRHSITTCTVENLIIHDYSITVYEYHMCQI